MTGEYIVLSVVYSYAIVCDYIGSKSLKKKRYIVIHILRGYDV